MWTMWFYKTLSGIEAVRETVIGMRPMTATFQKYLNLIFP